MSTNGYGSWQCDIRVEILVILEEKKCKKFLPH